MLQVKLLHDIVEEMAGEGTGRIAEILFKKKDVNEFLIAKRMELTINQVRNILYKLSAENLVSFVRKKDKRKGWYIYYWTLNIEKCLVKLESSLMGKIAGFEGVLNNRETKRFYVCKSCEIEVGEEKALEHGFSCEECANIYELSDNSRPIRESKSRIIRTKKNLSLIHKELEVVRKRKTLARKRASNKFDKEAAVKKELLKTVRAAARKKVADVKKKVARSKTSGGVGVRNVGMSARGKTGAVKKKVVGKVKKIVKKKVNLVSKLKKKIAGRK